MQLRKLPKPRKRRRRKLMNKQRTIRTVLRKRTQMLLIKLQKTRLMQIVKLILLMKRRKVKTLHIKMEPTQETDRDLEETSRFRLPLKMTPSQTFRW